CLSAPAITLFYTLSLHDALPIYVLVRYRQPRPGRLLARARGGDERARDRAARDVDRRCRRDCIRPDHWLLPRDRRRVDQPDRGRDRKSTRLNSSHVSISYAVFCL